MKKFTLFVLLCSVSITLLFLQYKVLQTYMKREKVEVAIHPTYAFISKVMSLSFKYNVPLFLMDQRIFKHIANGTINPRAQCKALCLGQKVTLFGTIGPVSSHLEKEAFIEAIESEGLKILQFKGSDPVLQQHGLTSPVPLHYIIYDKQSAIHVMILYERPGKFWWSGGYSPVVEDLQVLYETEFSEEISNILTSAAFEKVEIQSALVEGIKMYYPLRQDVFMDFSSKNQFIECNYSQAKLFHDTYGRDESDEAEIFRHKAWKLLGRAKTLLDQINVPFWLSSGTCLGFFRECGIIAHSMDVDIGVWIKDYKPEIVSVFSVHGIPLTHSFGKVDDSFELSFHYKGIKLDIFFFYEEKDYVWNGGTQARTGKKYKYIFPKFDLCWTEFLELKVRIPCQTEEYIKANYGPKWFEPVKVWDWKSSPPNVVENGQWPLNEWPEVIQLLPLPGQT